MCKYNNQCNNSCTTSCLQDSCGCISQYSGACIIYNGEELTNTGIAVGLNFNDIIKEIDEYFLLFRNEIQNFISIINIGNGAKVYKNDNLLGQKQLRSLNSGNPSLTVVENEDDITISIQSATQLLEGVIQLATQAEVDAGTDTVKAVTPSTLTTLISNPTNLPNATETQRGIAEIATQAEVSTGIDDEKIVTPAKLNTYVTTEITNTLSNLPNSTELQSGIIELATQAEVDAGVDTERAITPATLQASITTLISQAINALPASRIKNIGFANNVEIGDGVVPNSFPVGGDIVSFDRVSRTGDTDRFLVNFSNPMDDTNYYVKVFHETLGNPELDNDISVHVFRPISTTQCDVYIEATTDTSNDSRKIYIEIVQA